MSKKSYRAICKNCGKIVYVTKKSYDRWYLSEIDINCSKECNDDYLLKKMLKIRV